MKLSGERNQIQMISAIIGKKMTLLAFRFLGIPLLNLLEEFERIQSLDASELRRYQWVKIKDLLQHAVTHSLYYRKQFEALGITLEDIKDYQDFEKIPPISKNILKKRRQEFIATDGSFRLFEAKTSGSTGVPLKIYKDRRGLASTYAAMYQGHRWWGLDIGEKETRLWNIPLKFSGKLVAYFKDTILNRFRQRNPEVSNKTFLNFYDQLRKKRPVYLMGYPSYIYSFSRWLKKRGLDGRCLNLKLIKYTAESLHEERRKEIEDTFGCPCISEYGCAETGVISFECPERNQHIMAGSVYVELKKADIFSEENPYYEVIVTNLYSHSFPIIRYRTGDIVFPSEITCSCGCGFPTISKVIGRSHDIIIAQDGKKYHSSILGQACKWLISQGVAPDGIRFVQREVGEIEALFVDNGKKFQHKYRLIKDVIDKAFHGNIYLNLVPVSKIERDQSGKFRYFMSLLEEEKIKSDP